ncbi:hypothetical protein [Corynebacterium nasicanis]|uniref:Secreted protein n=1 Tax=Corynebacterium nasicanis TaxID=1448267 RepID=A0ABW1QAG0_9CORY
MNNYPQNQWEQAPPTNEWAQQPAQQSRGWLWILLFIAVAVVVTAVGVAAVLFGWVGGGGTSGSGPVTSTYTSTVQAEPQERAEQAVPAGSIPANAAARDNAPTGDYNSVWRGTSVTSEPFANAVRDAFVENYLATGDTDATLQVYSSVTGATYTMTCRDTGSYVTCTGGNNAVVHIS